MVFLIMINKEAILPFSKGELEGLAKGLVERNKMPLRRR